ncbi:unnamed protein product [Heterobilharzia americana]|nr:unnamed protein product [Heterobilharzia americana]
MNRSYSTNHYTILLPMNLSELIYYMHTTTLKHVITIAPYFPNEIRSTFHILSDLKLRLENAIKLSNPLINTTTTANDSNSNSNLYDQSQSRFQLKGISSNRYPVKQSEISLPSIKLKTDFSNFTYN